jgi:hypothetical protein
LHSFTGCNPLRKSRQFCKIYSIPIYSVKDHQEVKTVKKLSPGAQVAFIGLVLLFGFHAMRVPAMPPEPGVRGGTEDKDSRSAASKLDTATHQKVLNRVAAVIRDHYADREAGDALADMILAQLKQGRFDSASEPDSLVAQVMSVIRSMVPDRHFVFTVRSEKEPDSDASPSRELSPHGLRTVRLLENDIAYLEFDGLPGDDASLKAVAQEMAELPEVRIIVFDIRDNIGGSGDMVVLLCSHLLEANTLLYTFSDRSGGDPVEMRASAPQRHFDTAIPVFVLTGGTTLSAAEAFAYILQDYGRATLVGERTAGMANPSRTFSIGKGFELTVPFLLMRYGKSGGTYAGLGVEPDIEAPADSSMDVALREIWKRLGAEKQ